MALAEEETILHASCVSWARRGLLIMGQSGSGKSSMALSLMALGAGLVADDRVVVKRIGGRLIASAPPSITGLIEARGLGILWADVAQPAGVIAVLDMDQIETDRLPERRATEILGQKVELLRRVESAHFPAAMIQFLKAGRRDP